jgi:hypothetical protein
MPNLTYSKVAIVDLRKLRTQMKRLCFIVGGLASFGGKQASYPLTSL